MKGIRIYRQLDRWGPQKKMARAVRVWLRVVGVDYFSMDYKRRTPSLKLFHSVCWNFVLLSKKQVGHATLFVGAFGFGGANNKIRLIITIEIADAGHRSCFITVVFSKITGACIP